MNKNSILLLEPYFESKIWAGKKLNSIFDTKIKDVGEAWIISCLKNKSSWIKNLNCSLYDFYCDRQNAYFFNDYNLNHDYPLLTKIIDANDNLSVQLHPDDDYVRKFIDQKLNGKTECWYILDTKPNNSLIYGHNAKTRADFIEALNQNKIEDKLNFISIKKDDFIYVPSKKIHAILKDTLIFELQQSSDITYRIYDYNRLENNKPRDLHVKESLELLNFPDQPINDNKVSSNPNFYVNNNFFKLKKIIVEDLQIFKFEEANWVQITIIKGEAQINELKAKTFSSLLIAYNVEFTVKGQCEILLSYI